MQRLKIEMFDFALRGRYSLGRMGTVAGSRDAVLELVSDVYVP